MRRPTSRSRRAICCCCQRRRRRAAARHCRRGGRPEGQTRARARRTRRSPCCTPRSPPGAQLSLPWQPSYNALAYVIAGSGTVGPEGRADLRRAARGVRPGDRVTLAADARQDSRTSSLEVILLGGEPIGEPMVQYGPFVMNTRDELEQAVTDYHAAGSGSSRRTRSCRTSRTATDRVSARGRAAGAGQAEAAAPPAAHLRREPSRTSCRSPSRPEPATISSLLRPTKFHHITIDSSNGAPPSSSTRASAVDSSTRNRRSCRRAAEVEHRARRELGAVDIDRAGHHQRRVLELRLERQQRRPPRRPRPGRRRRAG